MREGNNQTDSVLNVPVCQFFADFCHDGARNGVYGVVLCVAVTVFWQKVTRWAKSDTLVCLSFIPHGLTGRTSGSFLRHVPSGCRGMTWLPEMGVV